MTALQLRIIIAGVEIKLRRGELLEDILATYIKLTDIEKQTIREHFNLEV